MDVNKMMEILLGHKSREYIQWQQEIQLFFKLNFFFHIFSLD